MLAVLLPVTGIALLAATADDPRDSEISRSDFEARGLTWPLIPDSGTLKCHKNSWVVFTPEGSETTYAVNGLAKATPFYEDLDVIWAEDRNVEGLKVSAGDLTEAGLALCP